MCAFFKFNGVESKEVIRSFTMTMQLLTCRLKISICWGVKTFQLACIEEIIGAMLDVYEELHFLPGFSGFLALSKHEVIKGLVCKDLGKLFFYQFFFKFYIFLRCIVWICFVTRLYLGIRNEIKIHPVRIIHVLGYRK